MILDKIFVDQIAMWYFMKGFGLNFDGIILKIFLAVAIVVCIDSERISYLLAIRNTQYMLLQFRIGKCMIVGLSIAYGVFFLRKIKCRT